MSRRLAMASPSSGEKATIPGAPVQQLPHWEQEKRNPLAYHSGSVDGIKGISWGGVRRKFFGQQFDQIRGQWIQLFQQGVQHRIPFDPFAGHVHFGWSVFPGQPVRAQFIFPRPLGLVLGPGQQGLAQSARVRGLGPHHQSGPQVVLSVPHHALHHPQTPAQGPSRFVQIGFPIFKVGHQRPATPQVQQEVVNIGLQQSRVLYPTGNGFKNISNGKHLLCLSVIQLRPGFFHLGQIKRFQDGFHPFPIGSPHGQGNALPVVYKNLGRNVLVGIGTKRKVGIFQEQGFQVLNGA